MKIFVLFFAFLGAASSASADFGCVGKVDDKADVPLEFVAVDESMDAWQLRLEGIEFTVINFKGSHQMMASMRNEGGSASGTISKDRPSQLIWYPRRGYSVVLTCRP